MDKDLPISELWRKRSGLQQQINLIDLEIQRRTDPEFRQKMRRLRAEQHPETIKSDEDNSRT